MHRASGLWVGSLDGATRLNGPRLHGSHQGVRKASAGQWAWLLLLLQFAAAPCFKSGRIEKMPYVSAALGAGPGAGGQPGHGHSRGHPWQILVPVCGQPHPRPLFWARHCIPAEDLAVPVLTSGMPLPTATMSPARGTFH